MFMKKSKLINTLTIFLTLKLCLILREKLISLRGCPKSKKIIITKRMLMAQRITLMFMIIVIR